jgi:hypothetical protein
MIISLSKEFDQKEVENETFIPISKSLEMFVASFMAGYASADLEEDLIWPPCT